MLPETGPPPVPVVGNGIEYPKQDIVHGSPSTPHTNSLPRPSTSNKRASSKSTEGLTAELSDNSEEFGTTEEAAAAASPSGNRNNHGDVVVVTDSDTDEERHRPAQPASVEREQLLALQRRLVEQAAERAVEAAVERAVQADSEEQVNMLAIERAAEHLVARGGISTVPGVGATDVGGGSMAMPPNLPNLQAVQDDEEEAKQEVDVDDVSVETPAPTTRAPEVVTELVSTESTAQDSVSTASLNNNNDDDDDDDSTTDHIRLSVGAAAAEAIEFAALQVTAEAERKQTERGYGCHHHDASVAMDSDDDMMGEDVSERISDLPILRRSGAARQHPMMDGSQMQGSSYFLDDDDDILDAPRMQLDPDNLDTVPKEHEMGNANLQRFDAEASFNLSSTGLASEPAPEQVALKFTTSSPAIITEATFHQMNKPQPSEPEKLGDVVENLEEDDEEVEEVDLLDSSTDEEREGKGPPLARARTNPVSNRNNRHSRKSRSPAKSPSKDMSPVPPLGRAATSPVPRQGEPVPPLESNGNDSFREGRGRSPLRSASDEHATTSPPKPETIRRMKSSPTPAGRALSPIRRPARSKSPVKDRGPSPKRLLRKLSRTFSRNSNASNRSNTSNGGYSLPSVASAPDTDQSKAKLKKKRSIKSLVKKLSTGNRTDSSRSTGTESLDGKSEKNKMWKGIKNKFLSSGKVNKIKSNESADSSQNQQMNAPPSPQDVDRTQKTSNAKVVALLANSPRTPKGKEPANPRIPRNIRTVAMLKGSKDDSYWELNANRDLTDDENTNSEGEYGIKPMQSSERQGRPTRRRPTRTRSRSEPRNFEGVARPKAASPVRKKTSQVPPLPKEEMEYLESVALALKHGLRYKDRKDRMGKIIRFSFTGSAAVDFLVQHTGRTRKEALETGRKIAEQFKLFAPTQTYHYAYTTGGNDSTLQRTTLLLDNTTTYRLMAYLPCEVETMLMEKKKKIFENGVPVRDRRQGFRKHKRCFTGREAVTFLYNARLVKTRDEGVELGRTLMRDFNLFEPVQRDHGFDDSSQMLFRFVDRRSQYFSINNMFSTRMLQIDGDIDTSDSDDDDETKSGDSNDAKSRDKSRSNRMPKRIASASLTRQGRKTYLRDDSMESDDFQKLREVSEVMERGMKLEDHSSLPGTKFSRLYKDTFVASRAVTFLVASGFADSRKEAEILGQRLEREFNLFREVTGRHDFADTNHFFRFTDKRDRFRAPLKADMPLESIAKAFEKGVKVKDYTYRLKTYRNTFVGSKAVDFLVNSLLANSRQEAVRIGRLLVEKFNLFERVTGDREFCDDYVFFRFTPTDKRRKPQEPRQGGISRTKRETIILARDNSAAQMREIPESLLKLAEAFLTGVKVKEHKFRAKPYRQTFVGSEAVSFMVNSSLAKSRKEAVELGRQLAKEVFLFKEIDGTRDFKDDYLLYRFADRFDDSANSEQQTPLRGLQGLSSVGNLSAKSLPLEKIAEAFRSGVQVKEHRERLKVYKCAFIGTDAVDFLVGSSFAESRIEAVDLGRAIAREYNFFEHVHKEHAFKDEDLLYQFCYMGPIRPLDAIEIEISRLLSIAKDFEANVKVTENRIRLRVYKDTFLGCDAVDYLVSSDIASDRKEAVQIGRAVTKEFNLFEHVTNDRQFEDAAIPYKFVKDDERYKGLKFEKVKASRNLFALTEYSDSEGSERSQNLQSSQKIGNEGSGQFKFESEDTDWASKMANFEKRMGKSAAINLSADAGDDGSEESTDLKVRFKEWASKFHRLDPRYQIHYFFEMVAQDGAENAEGKKINIDALRPILQFLPHRAQVFTVWRPTSYHAIRKMMLGEAVGKGLDVKGKSAKRGKLSGFVPFLQIGENNHKRKVRPPSKEGMVRVFYAGDARRARDIAAEKLERVAQEMVHTVEEAKNVLADETASEEAREDALEAMLLDMHDPSIYCVDDYAPSRYGLEIPERLFWEAYFVRQDCTRKPGSEYDTGRPSQPAFQDMNFAALRAKPKEGAPRACVYQSADSDSPMSPFELLIAYEENGRVMPVVSDFDCFLVGTKRVAFSSPLAPEQMVVLKWYISEIENVMKTSKVGDSWTVKWLDVLKNAAKEGFYPEMPRFGFGDPKSYSIMENAVDRLNQSGAVRHGAECFNYYFPQDLDDEFLVIANDLPDDKPWMYVDVEGLQDILEHKIEQGYTFPLNLKWVLCDAGRWKTLYDKLMQKEDARESMNVWFPPHSGLREQIERIHKLRPDGFYRGENPVVEEEEQAKEDKFARRKSKRISAVVAAREFESYRKKNKDIEAIDSDEEAGNDSKKQEADVPQ